MNKRIVALAALGLLFGAGIVAANEELVGGAGESRSDSTSAAQPGMVDEGLQALGLKEKVCRHLADGDRLPEEASDRARDRAHDALDRIRKRCAGQDRDDRPHAAPFNKTEDGTVVGKWVDLKPENGAIYAYTSKGPFADAVIFASIAPASWNAGDAKDGIRGGVYHATDGTQGIVVFNAPNAAFVIGTKDGGAYTFVVADGLRIEIVASDEYVQVAKISDGGHTALLTIRGGGTLGVEGQTITAELEAESGLVFRIEGYPRAAEAEKRFVDNHRHRDARTHDIVVDGPETIVADGSETLATPTIVEDGSYTVAGTGKPATE